jgi:hypothetical protein
LALAREGEQSVSTELWRAVIAVTNLGFIVLTGWLGYGVFWKSAEVPSSERAPKSFDALKYVIEETTVQKRTINSYSPIWKVLRSPAPAKPKPPPQATVAQPTAIETPMLDKQYKLLSVALNIEDPKRSSCLVSGGAGRHILLKVGEKIPETELILVALSAVTAGQAKGVKATVRDARGKVEDITLENKGVSTTPIDTRGFRGAADSASPQSGGQRQGRSTGGGRGGRRRGAQGGSGRVPGRR